ncbi:MAG: hypothetical protein JW832_10930 [Deltaproteobacteria bacterium]|nr:hypothetical protein [Deltaproteobacteria bacterium]
MKQRILKNLCRLAVAALVCAAASAQAAWKTQSSPTTDQLRAVDGYAENRILAVGNYGAILLYNGTEWQNVSGITEKTLYGVWWASKNEAFAVGDKGLILHFNGTDWNPMVSGTTLRLRTIWGASGSDVFAGGESGTILHYDGSSWKKMTGPTPLTIQGLWGNSATDVYAVGGASASDTTTGSFIIHYDGRQWTAQAALITPERFHGVWGDGDTVFAAGEAGAIFSSDTAGAQWAEMNSKTLETFRGLWGMSLTDVYAVGDYGTILHYDGSAWQPMPSGTDLRLFGIWGSSKKSIYAVGDAGLVLHYEDNSTDNTTCPFKAAVENEDDLRLLRATRDSRLDTLSGMFLTALFYAAAPETARIVQRTPDLRNNIAELVAQNRPLLQALAQGTSGQISSSSLSNISAFLKELNAAGSGKLALILAGLRHGLERGWLLYLLDITVE